MQRKSIPTTEAQLRDFIAAGMSRRQIAEKLKLDQGRLSAAMTVLGISTGTPPRAQAVKAHDAAALLLQGLTMNQIAAAFKCSSQSVRNALVAAKLPTNLRAAVLWSQKQKAKPVVNLHADQQDRAVAGLAQAA